MKVLLVAHEKDAGGVSHHVVKLSSELINFGHEVKIVWHTPNAINDISLPLHSKDPVSLFLSSFGLLRLLKDFSPDVVHVHSRMPFLAVLPWAKALKIPVVYTAHGNYSPHRLSKLISLANVVISLCLTHQIYVTKELGVDAEKIRIVGNGVDTERFKPKNVEKAKDDIVIGLVGRLVSAKGFSFFLKVFSYLPIQTKLVIVGDGELRETLEEEAINLNISSRVVFMGKRDDMESIYPTFDIFCLPSIKEVYPLVLLEAMSSGLACVASDVGCISEIGKNSIIVLPKSDLNLWVKSLLRLIEDKEGRQSLSKRALERSKTFSWKNVAKRVEEIYLEVIKNEK
ncbi:Glycosyltransferase involved in cell wall bisynthesis [Thermodesulfobium acidiphilum]|uniref:Glycosyltransferase involved in cell wall bisynthesis n=1 Tax=Thermodesulfobium acidiphilum TaxID=1794699 RepID=A0A2R4W2D0_THEAF|nr:glycosyltransferase family 4 protein [Thermodesulfobium acidiphilum]AWB10969.1 Glycosyltransferase involved in cell wall bisynthesis [Thermodesulfobium acidiphilum]